MTEPLVEVRDLQKYFYEENTLLDRLLGRDPVAVKAVDGVSFDVYRGETLGLVGESGCGKSTCGETLVRLQEPTGGTVRFDGRDVFDLTGRELKAFRRDAQLIFQDPFSTLDPRIPIGETVKEPLAITDWPWTDPAVTTRADLRTEGVPAANVTVHVADDVDRVLTVEDDVATATVTVRRLDDATTPPVAERGVDVAGDVVATVAEDLAVAVRREGEEIVVDVSVGRSDERLRDERVAYLLDRVGISTDQLDRYPHEFSGGQRQRIGIARALALEPDFLVLDEPTSALDVSVQAQILNLLAELQAEFDLTYLLISHDLSVVRHVSDRVAVMYLGEIVEIGPTGDLFAEPRHPYTAALLESVPRASADEQDREIEVLRGDVPSPRNPPSGCRFRTRCPVVIPPDDLDIDQRAFRAIMDVRQRIESGEVDLAGIRERIDADADADGHGGDGSEAETEAVVARLADQLLNVELPARDERILNDAFHALADGDWAAAEAMLADRYASVCENVSPVLQDGWVQPVACHRYDQPGTDESVVEPARVEQPNED